MCSNRRRQPCTGSRRTKRHSHCNDRFQPPIYHSLPESDLADDPPRLCATGCHRKIPRLACIKPAAGDFYGYTHVVQHFHSQPYFHKYTDPDRYGNAHAILYGYFNSHSDLHPHDNTDRDSGLQFVCIYLECIYSNNLYWIQTAREYHHLE